MRRVFRPARSRPRPRWARAYAQAVPDYSDDTLSMKVYALSLLDASATSDGLRDGIADVGYLLMVYCPSMYPHTKLRNESSMQLTQFDEAKPRGEDVPESLCAADRSGDRYHHGRRPGACMPQRMPRA